MRTPLGVREEKKSVAAMKAPKTQAMVVKKPKTFWIRVKEECMVDSLGGAPRARVVFEGIPLRWLSRHWRVEAERAVAVVDVANRTRRCGG